MRVKYPSLELNWLPKPKWVSLPLIVFNHDHSYGGCYHHPQQGEALINGRYYPLDNGIIEVREDGGPSTMVHEFRHHLQAQYVELTGSSWTNTAGNSYKERIIRYFLTQPTEMDALLFECKHYPDDCNKEWVEWIVKKYEAIFMRNVD